MRPNIGINSYVIHFDEILYHKTIKKAIFVHNNVRHFTQPIMIVISSAELRNNMKKYLDLAKTQEVVIQRGRTETFVLKSQQYLQPDEDLERAISMDELLSGVKEDIQEIYKAKK